MSEVKKKVKRGRKAGTKFNSTEGSLSWHLAKLELGEDWWFEVETDKWKQKMRNIVKPASRLPLDVQGKKFSVQVFRAVPCTMDDHFRVLLKVTRTE